MGRNTKLKLLEDIALSSLPTSAAREQLRPWEPGIGDWVRIVRTYLKMTQVELARRAGINKANLIKIEKGAANPSFSTVKRIFDALSCDLLAEPRPRQPLKDILRGQARSIASNRLKQTMGTMALENQAPSDDVFKTLLEKQTDEILNDPREHLWRDENERRRNRRNTR